MNCPHCQTRIEDSANFCPECGSKLRALAPPSLPSTPGEDEQQASRLLEQAREMLAGDDADGARYAAQAAIALAPGDAAGHMLLGEVFQHQGRISEAISQFEVTLRLDSSSIAAAQKLDALRSQPVARAVGAPRRFWATAGMAAAGVAIVAGGFALISSAGGPQKQADPHPTGLRIGQPLSPTHLPPQTGTGSFSGSAVPNKTGATLKPASAPAAITPLQMPTATLSRARPASPGYVAGTPAIRVGLPPVANGPGTAGVPTLGPAVPRALEPVANTPVSPGAMNGLRPQDPRGVAPARPYSPPPQTGPTPAPEILSGKKSGAGEPLEPDTGFIKIEPVNRGDQSGESGQPKPGGNPDGRGITVPLERR